MKKKIAKEKNILFLDENSSYIYSLDNGKIKKSISNFDNIKKVILIDSLIDLKHITIPAVQRRLLRNIVINTVKKHSTVISSEENIDYKIIKKEDNKYEILVFMRHEQVVQELNKKKIFTTYHIIENILKDKEYPDDVSFITNIGKTWFVYTFKDRKFKSRGIYFKEDIKNLNKKDMYFLDIYSEKDEVNSKSFKKITKDKINNAIDSLKNNIFKEEGYFGFYKKYIYILMFTGICLFLFFEIRSLQLIIKSSSLNKDKNYLEKILTEERSKRGISDDLYKEYIKLLSKKSNVNEFFKGLYIAGKNNIEIEKLNYDRGKFSIIGYCKNDSILEQYFRKASYWKNVNFSFSRKNNKIIFNIKGLFDND